MLQIPVYFFYLHIVLALLSQILLKDVPDDAENKVPDYDGESLGYRLNYGIFSIGTATISFEQVAGECGVHIVSIARSTGILKLINDIDYRYEACMDPATGLPASAIRSLQDRRYSLYNELEFDQSSRPDSTVIYSKMSGEHIVQKDIYDILTGFFQFRKNYIHQCKLPGDSVIIKTFFTDELWDLNIRYEGKEMITTKYGAVDCIKFRPETVVGRFFTRNDAVTVWFSRDEHAIPVRISLDLIIGSIQGDLVEYKPAKNKPAHRMIRQELISCVNLCCNFLTL